MKPPSAEVIAEAVRVLLPGEDVTARCSLAHDGSWLIRLRWVSWTPNSRHPLTVWGRIEVDALELATSGPTGSEAAALLLKAVVEAMKREREAAKV